MAALTGAHYIESNLACCLIAHVVPKYFTREKAPGETYRQSEHHVTSTLCLQVSIVSQEPILFAESILYNITFGVQDPSSISLAQVRLPAHPQDKQQIMLGLV